MTVFLSPPVPLDRPPGEPAALDDLTQQLAAAAFRLGEVHATLESPAGCVPGWLGDDALAAGTRIAAIAVVVVGSVGALRTATGRLSDHRDRLQEARERVAVLLAEQEDDYARACARLAALPDPGMALRAGMPAAVVVLEEWEAAEVRRRVVHGRILTEVADDAAATALLLAQSTGHLGGSGQWSDESAVVRLAALLPGWGEGELAARGAALGERLTMLIGPEEREASAIGAAPYADQPAFADAVLSRLGVDGVRGLLADLGSGALGHPAALAVFLSSVLGAADRTATATGPISAVLDAALLEPEGTGRHVDVVALGMGAVIAAGSQRRSAGPGADTVLAWGRQLLARERALAGHAHGGRAVDRAEGPPGSSRLPDPVAAVITSLARSDDPAPAAALLSERAAWDRLLARPWDDDAAALADLVARAADQPHTGAQALRTGLEALGGGLADNQPDDWTVDRHTLTAISPALGRALSQHVTVAVDALMVGVHGSPDDPAAADGLRGVGLIGLDPEAAQAVGSALFSWVGTELARGTGSEPEGPTSAVAVPAAYLAAHQWALDMDHALDCFAAQAEAERRELGWEVLTAWTGIVPGVAGDVIGFVEGYAAILLGMDGTWENPPAPGVLVGADDAAAGAANRTALSAGGAAEAARQAALAFERTTAALGDPVPAQPPPVDLLAPLQDAVLPRREHPVGPPRWGVGSRSPG